MVLAADAKKAGTSSEATRPTPQTTIPDWQACVKILIGLSGEANAELVCNE